MEDSTEAFGITLLYTYVEMTSVLSWMANILLQRKRTIRIGKRSKWLVSKLNLCSKRLETKD